MLYCSFVLVVIGYDLTTMHIRVHKCRMLFLFTSSTTTSIFFFYYYWYLSGEDPLARGLVEVGPVGLAQVKVARGVVGVRVHPLQQALLEGPFSLARYSEVVWLG